MRFGFRKFSKIFEIVRLPILLLLLIGIVGLWVSSYMIELQAECNYGNANNSGNLRIISSDGSLYLMRLGYHYPAGNSKSIFEAFHMSCNAGLRDNESWYQPRTTNQWGVSCSSFQIKSSVQGVPDLAQILSLGISFKWLFTISVFGAWIAFRFHRVDISLVQTSPDRPRRTNGRSIV
jgi:hypothetical protein